MKKFILFFLLFLLTILLLFEIFDGTLSDNFAKPSKNIITQTSISSDVSPKSSSVNKKNQSSQSSLDTKEIPTKAININNNVYVSIFPEILNNGEFFKITLSSNVNPLSSIKFLQKTYPIFKGANGVFSSIIPVPLDTKEGLYKITVDYLEKQNIIYENINEIKILNKDRGFDYITLSQEITKSAFSEESIHEDAEIRAETSALFSVGNYWNGAFLMPCDGEISTIFGVGRSYNNQPVSSYHLGLDIAADMHTKINAPAKGIIKLVVESPLRGLMVYIDHGLGVQSSLAHLDSAFIKAGDVVTKETLIGTVGSSGASTGPHLHWEVSVWDTLTDPFVWTTTSLFD
ncbi:MAG: hypothetical protein CL779_00395 [Chloroflexi bacterium]|nr:hypothetical protein [Chloroflexota bacterium]|tara:strand:+ start:10506 stop:11540 length:1035 start_codon:yes stop_codon:yes gene_type:complete